MKASLPRSCAFSYCSRKLDIQSSSDSQAQHYRLPRREREPIPRAGRDPPQRSADHVPRGRRGRGALAAQGIKAGDRVSLVMSDSPEMIFAFLGIMGSGAIAVPCSTLLPPEGLSYVFKDSEAKLVIVSP